MLLRWASSLVSGGGGDGGVAHLRQVDPFAIGIGTQAGGELGASARDTRVRTITLCDVTRLDGCQRSSCSLQTPTRTQCTMIQLHAYACLEDRGPPKARVVLD